MKAGNTMTISKSHYHRKRLLRGRICKADSQLPHTTSDAPQPIGSEFDDGFPLPEYFRDAAHYSNEASPPTVILWDEVV